MRKRILNIILFSILITIIMFGIFNLTNEESIKEYGLSQKLLLASAPPSEWESNQINEEYGIPMYSGQALYCAGAGTRVRYVGDISYYKAKKWVGEYDIDEYIGVNDGDLTYVLYRAAGGGPLSPAQAYIVSSGGSSDWSEKKQHALWNLSGSSDLVHDKNGMKAQGADLAAEANLYAAYHSTIGEWENVSGDSSRATVKVNQKTKQYIVGPYTVNYPEGAVQDGIAFGGISNMSLNGGAISISGLIIDGKLQSPDYFTPDGEMVDRKDRNYPESGKEFYVVFNDPNANGGNVTEVALSIEFKYMVCEGQYRIYNGTQYRVDISYDDKNNDGKDDVKEVSLIRVSSAPQPAMWAEAKRVLREKKIEFKPVNITIELGGYVWEDGKSSKETRADGDRTTGENIDKPLPNIRVILSDGKETRTDKDGSYRFKGLDAMKKYTVSFEYNGQIYMPTEYMVDGVAWENSSKGLEKQKERDAFDKKFAEIGSSPNNYGSNKRTFTKLELMGYELGEDGKYRKTGVQLIDGYEYDENGYETNNYTLAEANPNTSDPEIAQKLQFIKDCQIKSYTDKYPDVNPFVIGNKSETVAGTKYKPLYDRVFYINQGLWRRQEFDAALRKDVYRAVLKINDKTVVYKYDKRNDDEKYWDINVRMSDYEAYYNSGYNRELYRSDYDYVPSEEHTGSPLEMYVTYKITVRNQSMSIMTQIKEVVDFYDKDYTYMENLSWVTYQDGDKSNTVTDEEYYNALDAENITNILNARPINSSNTSKYGESTASDLATSGSYGSIYIKGLENKKLATGESAYIYLTFKANKDENGKIILDDESSPKQNFAEINGYSTYYKNDTQLPNDIKKDSNNIAGLIDIDSNPGNLSLKDINNNEKYEKNFEDDTDRAKGLRIVIDENAIREANGTVWEDERNILRGESFIGDGIKDAERKEGRVAGVIVALVEKLDGGKEYIWQTTNTNQDGYYEFKGYIPGDYVIKFYYGISSDTVETKENGGLNDVSYNGQDFKSTIYQAEMIQNDITNSYEKDESKQYKGYKDVENQNESGTYGYDIYAADAFNKNVSDAKDIWSRREAVINYSNKEVTNHKAEVLASPYQTPTYNGVEYQEERKNHINELILNTYMVAETGVIPVEFEYNRNKTEGEKVSNGENNYLYGNDINGVYKLNNIDFGLVERPKSQLEINKSISNVKLQLANGNVLFDVNKGNKVDDLIWRKNTPYKLADKKDSNGIYPNGYSYRDEVTKLVKKHNNGLVQITMDEELMHGATIQITYKVKVINSGEVDYEGKNFYYTGENAGNVVVTKADQVIDYISNNLKYDATITENASTWNIINKQDLTSAEKNLVNSHLVDNINSFNNIIETTSFAEYELIPGDKTPEKTLILSQLITTDNSSDDLSYDNMVEIVKTSNTVGRRMAYSVVGNQNPMATKPDEVDASMAESVIILPPFGQMYIFYILGVVIAGMLIGGIIFIRKKVLKK